MLILLDDKRQWTYMVYPLTNRAEKNAKSKTTMNIPIVLACDKNYTPFLAACIASVLSNASVDDNLEIYILDDDIPIDDRQKILLLKNIKDCKISFISITSKICHTYFDNKSYLTQTAYARLFAADVLQHLDKAIYIDVDTIVFTSLAELYTIDLTDKFFAAFPENRAYNTVEAMLNIGIIDKPYFNSGVLIINFNLWRKNNITSQLIDLIPKIKDKIRSADQDILNYFFGSYVELDEKWNCNPYHYNYVPDVRIIHYFGPKKLSQPHSIYLKKYMKKTGYLIPTTSRKLWHQNIKSRLKLIVKYILTRKLFISKINSWIIRIGIFAQSVNNECIDKKRGLLVKSILKHYFPVNIVAYGPFKGMQYQQLDSFCDTTWEMDILRRLLGNYEAELHADIENILNKEPEQIINIGCADGYYLVGLALRCPRAYATGFDINHKAKEYCRQMAILNNVDNRIKILGACNGPNDLLAFSNDKATLIISDVGGLERKIFTKEVFTHFFNAIFIIEVHDSLNIYISLDIKEASSATHNCEEILPISCERKAQQSMHAELSAFHLEIKKDILNENRSRSGNFWLILTPKFE